MEITTSWLSEWLPNLGGVSFSAATVLGMTYFWLWLVLPMLRKQGWTEIKLPLGVSFKVENIAEYASMDMVVIECINSTIKQIDGQTTKQIRDMVCALVREKMNKSPDNKDIFYKTRFALSEIVADNNIISEIFTSGIEQYTEDKLTQVFNVVGDTSQEIQDVIKDIINEFVDNIISIQKIALRNKISAYEHAIESFKIDGNKVRCQSKIQRNKDFLDSLGASSQTGIFKGEIGGVDMIKQHLDNMDNMMTGMSDSGIITCKRT